MVDPANIAVILNLEAPRSVKQLRATLAHIRYYKKFIKGYAKITTPIEKLLKKGCHVLLERGLSGKLGYVKGKNGHRTDFSLPRLEEGVSCTCRHVMYNIGSNADIGWRRRIGPSYNVRKQEVIQG